MQWAALICWVLTATAGASMLIQWRRHGGFGQREGIRRARLLTHAGVAVAGLLLWIVFVATGARLAAWLAFSLLLIVGLLGGWMLTIWARGSTSEIRTETPAEGIFPVPLVIVHGLLAATTLVLSALAAAGVGT